MFNSTRKNSENTNRPPSGQNSSNSLAFGTRVEGSIEAHNDIRIDGTLIGNLDCNGRVIIGEQGSIRGIVKCENALVEGKLDGELYVNDALQVTDSAFISGEVRTAQLKVSQGAHFNVSCAMGKEAETIEFIEALKIEAV